ncbi:hypothetical protein BU26DRAFT_233257 [Trematosphaeria pertusa]|uniref:Uncharacterized protein n=1 Tax=Trematosphaeria pertusa TaxID=390896 RepID=A0A6A6IVP7_9PLEO|nr:uncharacterized protein BU26DRAFT_233257 [Trematosphaeria pertusa]KAF2253992.1 hypothetical protein BU26DRAFT_233257 [Trematosphaeria pertusa]
MRAPVAALAGLELPWSVSWPSRTPAKRRTASIAPDDAPVHCRAPLASIFVRSRCCASDRQRARIPREGAPCGALVKRCTELRAARLPPALSKTPTCVAPPSSSHLSISASTPARARRRHIPMIPPR